jgi:hypothetical protein
MLTSRVRYGWQKKGHIYVLVGESSGFCSVLTNELLGGAWSRSGGLLGDGMLL